MTRRTEGGRTGLLHWRSWSAVGPWSLACDVGEAVVGQVTPAARMLVDRHLMAGHFCVVLSASPQEVGHPVAINPDRSLRRHARTEGWPVLDIA